jgi:hypothetical protein
MIKLFADGNPMMPAGNSMTLSAGTSRSPNRELGTVII